MTAALVSIIGPPAVGKTTLAEGLAAELPARLIREDYAGNPFLAESYVGQDASRLPSQLYFLMSRVQQLSVLTWPREGLFVSDYVFCHDRIFARLRLNEEDYRLYDPLAGRLEQLVHPPEVLVLLAASAETLLDRIARRGRNFEQAMTADFLTAMRQRCEGAATAAGCSVVAVDCDLLDVRLPADRRRVAADVRARLARTKEHVP